MHPIDGVAGEVGQHEVVQVLQHADVEPRQLAGEDSFTYDVHREGEGVIQVGEGDEKQTRGNKG